MKHIYDTTTIGNIAQIRPFGINEYKKLLPYSYEVENEWIIPQFTPTFFKKISDTEKGNYEDVMQETYYDDGKCYSEGLQLAMAYLTYSRFVLNRDMIVTASGLRLKNGEMSELATDSDVIRLSNEAKNIGLKYLNHVVAYCKYKGYIIEEEIYNNEKEINRFNNKWKIIGD